MNMFKINKNPLNLTSFYAFLLLIILSLFGSVSASVIISVAIGYILLNYLGTRYVIKNFKDGAVIKYDEINDQLLIIKKDKQ